MFHFQTKIALRATALMMLFGSIVRAEERNCPQTMDILVSVASGQSTPIKLPITNFDSRSSVSIFQYPLGGTLQQTGPTDLDYLFLPAADFSGTTDFTYRLEGPRGCGNGTQLGRVTLSGGVARGTSTGLIPPPKPAFNLTDVVCGSGTAQAALVSLTLVGAGRTRLRRRSQRM